MRRLFGLLVLAVILAGCIQETVPPPGSTGSDESVALAPPSFVTPPISLRPNTSPRAFLAPRIVKGTGRFVAEPSASPEAARALTGEPVTLDFAGVDVRDAMRSVLGDILKVPYAIDPGVQGTITLRTNGAIPRDRLLPTLEGALRPSNAAIVVNNGFYNVVPLDQATRGIALSAGPAVGYQARVVTPRYISAADLDKLLEPLLPPGTTLRVEPTRNVLIVSGPAEDVASVLENLAVFDVDTLRGLSTGLLPLRSGEAATVAKDVQALIAALGGAGQLIHVVPLERLNALFVTSMRPDDIDRVRHWVERLDRGGESITQQLFVYRVQNGRASDIANVLRKALGLSASSDTGSPASASGGTAGETSPGVPVGPSGGGLAPAVGSSSPLLGALPQAAPPPSRQDAGNAATGNPPAGGNAFSDIRITSDETNNALLIMATPQEYSTIDTALRQLDIPSLQVMIEATVAEVTLTDQLAYGLQYYVKSGNFQALFANAGAGGTQTAFPGFGFASGLNLAYSTVGGSSAVLQLLQQLTQVRVLSSPNLMVLNNQAARIQVGDQVPIATSSAVGTLAPNAPIVNSIDYRDTGVILKVTPRVNASGVVSLDISEEVSDVGNTTSSTLNSPTISERRLETSVSINDGQTIALGGLIKDSRTRSRNGIPILQDLPGVGWLFGTRSNTLSRTELIVILSPHVVRNPLESRLVTQELQSRVPLTIPLRAPAR